MQTVKTNSNENNIPGYYGRFGGQLMPELLMNPIIELENHWKKFKDNQNLLQAFQHSLTSYAGRPTPLTEAKRLSASVKGPQVFLKREDLLHTGAHKLNNALGQCLLAKEFGKSRIIAETGAGQHGVATATACARLGLECTIYMGKTDVERQSPNVEKMKLMGATVVSVEQGNATLKEAINQTLRDWASSFESTHYCLGSALGPHPFPEMVKEFQSIIGREIDLEFSRSYHGAPDMMIACVGGGSNAIGMFAPFLSRPDVQLIGVEAGGFGTAMGEHASRFRGGRPGILHGSSTYLLQDEFGQIGNTHSISAGMDYPAVGPEHSFLYESGRVKYTQVSDAQALQAFNLLAKTEGIIPALESSHAIAYFVEIAAELPKHFRVVINLSGRGDKDLPTLLSQNKEFLL